MSERAPLTGALRHLDGLLFSSEKRYTADEISVAAGVDVSLAERLWWAMGFVPSDGEAIYVQDDLRALRLAADALEGLAPLDQVVYQTRVMAASLSRVAEVVADNIVAQVGALQAAGMTEAEVADALDSPNAEQIDRLIGYVYRRQLRAALWRKLADPEQVGVKSPRTIGFVDLVRFTAITEDIEEDELAGLIDRFETLVHDAVTAGGGRIVKMIGDEVLFEVEDPMRGVLIAWELVHSLRDDASMPPARAGLAEGQVLSYAGDCFGPVVNLASRIVGIARPSTVVVSSPLHEALAAEDSLSWRRLPPRRLKGIGRVQLYGVSQSA